MSHTVCRDYSHTVRAKILKIQALVQLSMYSESIELLAEVLGGAGLPLPATDQDKPLASHLVGVCV